MFPRIEWNFNSILTAEDKVDDVQNGFTDFVPNSICPYPPSLLFWLIYHFPPITFSITVYSQTKPWRWRIIIWWNLINLMSNLWKQLYGPRIIQFVLRHVHRNKKLSCWAWFSLSPFRISKWTESHDRRKLWLIIFSQFFWHFCVCDKDSQEQALLKANQLCLVQFATAKNQ